MTRSTAARHVARLLLIAVPAVVAATRAAAADEPPSFFVQAGSGEEAVRAASVGGAWNLPWRGSDGAVVARAEAFVSSWDTPSLGGGHRRLVQVGLVPMLRWRLDGGRSPWFAETGIGVSLLDGDLRTPQRTFRTRLNFSDNTGVGRSFGARREHEVSLRWQHTSNAGIRKPNPGQDLVLVRYAHAF
ncbi:acyloxyacyl hydrolase [Ramlibacter sp. MMS24-I3-19]|uniref:acyloxyacyl hydrolase n=1 Tax=Ramlibacter sp. MMS24-I3-19 TaxID=3416606 RepID=UPI003CFC8F55